MPTEDWTISGADDKPIYGTTHRPPPGDWARGVVFICHGFKGYKDYGFLPTLAETLARKGLIAHRFNFSHSGVTPDFSTFAHPELFERDTWGKQIYDLQAVAQAAAACQLPGSDPNGLPVLWFGHSCGGVTVVLTAARVFESGDQSTVPSPAGVITAAALQTAMSLDTDQIHRLRHRGYLESPSSRTGQVLRVGKAWLEEIENNPKAFDPIAAVRRIACPMLLMHGDADATVPVEASRLLAGAAGDRATLHIIPGASHVFDSPNPLSLEDEPPALTQRMIDLTCDFAVKLCP